MITVPMLAGVWRYRGFIGGSIKREFQNKYADLPRLVLDYMIKDRLGQQIFGTDTRHMAAPLEGLRAGDTVEYRFRFPLNLGPGNYSITTALTGNDTHLANNYEWRDLAFLFIVMNMNRKTFIGINWIEPIVEVVR